MKDAFVVRGVNVIGFESYYTGKAGEQFVGPAIDNAFAYDSIKSAHRKASMLNQMSLVHGWRFMVVSRVNGEMRTASFLECLHLCAL